MFTGIVQGMGFVVDIDEKANFRTHIIEFPADLLDGLKPGASVAHNGCCLTVTKIEGCQVSFDLMQETLRITNLGQLTVGDQVNLERAARFGDEIGGHQMSGHIMCTAQISNILVTENNYQMCFQLPKQLVKYVLPKGYIGIDGISLTVGDVTDDSFSVHLIPETLQRTMLSQRQRGQRVNIEIDPQTQMVVDTVERVLKAAADKKT